MRNQEARAEEKPRGSEIRLLSLTFREQFSSSQKNMNISGKQNFSRTIRTVRRHFLCTVLLFYRS